MKIYNLDIKKAFLGSLPLTSKNAYIGNYKVISGDTPGPTPALPAWVRFEGMNAGSEVSLSITNFGTNQTDTAPNIQISRDAVNWETIDTTGEEVVLGTTTRNNPIYVRGNNPKGISSSTANYSTFSHSNTGTTGVYVEGNIMALIDIEGSSRTAPNYCFFRLFGAGIIKLYAEGDCSNLHLPATTLGPCSYYYMFNNQERMTKTPTYPFVEDLPSSVYAYMFYGNTQINGSVRICSKELQTSDSALNMFNVLAQYTPSPNAHLYIDRASNWRLSKNSNTTVFSQVASNIHIDYIDWTTVTSNALLGPQHKAGVNIYLGTDVVVPDDKNICDTLLLKGSKSGNKTTTYTYNIFTDNETIKDQMLAGVDQYTIITVKHFDGSDW